MANGIEYREIEGIIEAYNNYGMPNFSVWAGPSLKVKYEGGNMDEGSSLLRSFLNQIALVATTTVYSIRVYPEETRGINNKTAYEGSFTFMLGDRNREGYRNEQGVIVLPGQNTPAPRNTIEITQLNERIRTLENDLSIEREKRHRAELDNLRNEFNNKISGLQNIPQTDKWMDLAEKAVEKPEIIEKLFGGLGSLLDKFNTRTVPQPNTGALNGTEHKSNTMHEDEDEKETGTDTETELSAEDQALYDRMDNALVKIEEKIGTEPLILALEKLAGMSKAELSVILKMM